VARAATFAQPILRHLRDLVHRGCPEATETLKWNMPHFEHGGSILAGMAAFKAHCVFGFWHKGMETLLAAEGLTGEGAMGGFGRITRLEDLPDETAILRFVREAAKLNASGVPGRPRAASGRAKKEPPVPADLTAALKKDRNAARTFAEFSPSHRKEYIEWITEAKRPETRAQRLAKTLEWLAEGKSRHWKYTK
jgi:uncharacterized protein YdeI (YjbR/CyaY-like superfamily)